MTKKLIILFLFSQIIFAEEIYNTSCEDLSVAILNCNQFRCQNISKKFPEKNVTWEVHGWADTNKCVISKIVPSKTGDFAYTCAYTQAGRNKLAEYHEFNLNDKFPVVPDSYKTYCELNSYDQYLKKF